MLENRKWQKDWQVQVRGTQKDKKNYKKTKSDKKHIQVQVGGASEPDLCQPCNLSCCKLVMVVIIIIIDIIIIIINPKVLPKIGHFHLKVPQELIGPKLKAKMLPLLTSVF